MDEGATRTGTINDTLAVHEFNHSFRMKYKTSGQATRNPVLTPLQSVHVSMAL